MYDAVAGRFCGRDPITYYGGINLYQYVLGGVLRYSDPLGFSPFARTTDSYEGLGCFEIADLRFTGLSWGDKGIPINGDKWWLKASHYISGTLRMQLIFDDTVHCECPNRDVSVHGVINLKLQFKYIQVVQRWQVIKQLGTSLFAPFILKVILAGNSGKHIHEAIAKAKLGHNLTDLSAKSICASGQKEISFDANVSVSGLTSGEKPGEAADKGDFAVDADDSLPEALWCPEKGLHFGPNHPRPPMQNPSNDPKDWGYPGVF